MKVSACIVLLALAALGGCSGGGTTPSAQHPGKPSSVPTQDPSSIGGNVTIVIPLSAAKPTSTARSVRYISPGTSTVTITVNGGPATTSDVSATSSLCTTAVNARSCSVPIAIPGPGPAAVSISLYNASHVLLGQGSATGTAVAGQTFSLAVSISPIPSLFVSPTISYSGGTQFVQGTGATATIVATLGDADGVALPTGTTFASPLTISTTNTHVTVSPTSLATTSASQTFTLTYDGSPAALGSVKILLTSGTNVTSPLNLPIRLKAQAVYVAGPSTSSILRFSSGAVGQSTPTTTIFGTAPVGVATDATNEYVLAIDGSISVFPLGTTTSTPLRRIAGTSTQLCNPSDISVYSGTIYVADSCAGILEYPASASGNVAPTSRIFGPTAGIQPTAIAVASSGIYVTNPGTYGYVTVPNVSVFPLSATGDARPQLIIPAGTSTFDASIGPQGVAVDAAGNVYVSSLNSPTTAANSIAVFAPGSSTKSYAISGGGAGFCGNEGLAFDTSGLLLVANGCPGTGTYNSTIASFAVGATNANSPPVRIIGGPPNVRFDNTGCCGRIAIDSSNTIYASNTALDNVVQLNSGGSLLSTVTLGPVGAVARPSGIAFDSSQSLYVANNANGMISVYPAGASGLAAPTRTIVGSPGNFNCPGGLALDTAGHVFASTSCAPFAVFEFASGASGQPTPLATIQGSASGLNIPQQVATDSSGTLYVANQGNNTISVYNAGAIASGSPSAVIGGSATGLTAPTGVAVDASGAIYAYSTNPGQVTVYPAGATGNAAPIRTITGNLTRLYNGSYGYLTLDALGNIYVSNGGQYVVFRPSSSGNAIPDLVVSNSALNGYGGIAISPTQP